MSKRPELHHWRYIGPNTRIVVRPGHANVRLEPGQELGESLDVPWVVEAESAAMVEAPVDANETEKEA